MSPRCHRLVAAALMLPSALLLSAISATAQDQPSAAARPNVVVDIEVTTDPETRPSRIRLVVEDGDRGSVHSHVVGGPVFNVTVAPHRLSDGAIRLDLQLRFRQTGAPDDDSVLEYDKGVAVVLQVGQPLVVLAASGLDGAAGITVEVTATIMGDQQQAQVAPVAENIRELVAEGHVGIEGDPHQGSFPEDLQVAPDDTGRTAQRVTGRPDDEGAGSGGPVTASMVPQIPIHNEGYDEGSTATLSPTSH